MAKGKGKKKEADEQHPEPKDFPLEESGTHDEHECCCNEGLLESDDVRTGYISGIGFSRKPVQFAAVNGRAIVEGCIYLGTVEEVEENARLIRSGDIQDGVGIAGNRFRWPNGVMAYKIDPSLPNKSRVTDAIAHWREKTEMDFVERTNQANYVYFTAKDGCWSSVGMRGGKQEISLASGCGFGATVHEIGHAFGLWHEQSRADRDDFVTIKWQNIKSGREHNFNQHINDGIDLGTYNYGSIMHYGRTAFSKNGQPTIVPKDSGAQIGQRTGLSQGDVDAIHELYDKTTTTTTLQTVKVIRVYASPASMNAWGQLEGIGWRKIKKDSEDGVTNAFASLCAAVSNDMNARVKLQGNHITEVYL